MIASIVVPTYNRSDKLIETIESIEKNSFGRSKFEIIIVEDKSPDNTQEIVKELRKKHKNIVYKRNSENRGPAFSRNRGARISKGKYVFFTDDDCVVPGDWIEKYVKFFDENKDVGCVGGPLEAYRENFIARFERLKDKVLGINTRESKIGGREVSTGFTNNTAYRKEVFKNVGYFDENFKMPSGEDLEFKNRVAEKYKVALLPVKVKHNHEYDFDYLFAIMIKQGLEKRPPKKTWKKFLMLIFYSPLFLFKVISKIFRYRN